MTTQMTPLKPSNTFAEWQAKEGIPIVTGFFIEDVNQVKVAPWKSTGGRGAFVNLDGTGGTNTAYVCEIAPGGSLKPRRHLYEEMVYVTKGRGATTVWNRENEKHSFEWQAGSVFAIPLNAWYQHFNGSGTESVRFFAVNDAPTVMNLFHNLSFVFDNPFTFEDRFGDPKHFHGDGEMYQGPTGNHVWETNFVPDVVRHQLYDWKERGAGGTNIMFELAHNTMAAHISEFPVGTYKKAHRHGPGAHVIILTGQGFSMLWPRGKPEKRVKVNWKPGSVVVPPTQWFHQHFNTGTELARYLALRWGSQRYLISGDLGVEERVELSEKEGGAQIEYEDEDRAIHQTFEGDLAKVEALCRMKRMVPWCSGKAT
jgi:quercetin dioxygenase-like cupin family protein